jgi:hypothetical protein
MRRSSLAYIPFFSGFFFCQLNYTDYANWGYFEIEKRGDEILIYHYCFSISQNVLKF